MKDFLGNEVAVRDRIVVSMTSRNPIGIGVVMGIQESNDLFWVEWEHRPLVVERMDPYSKFTISRQGFVLLQKADGTSPWSP